MTFFYNSRRLFKFDFLAIILQIKKYIDFHMGQDLKHLTLSGVFFFKV